MALTDNLVAYWKFDEGSGTSAADATGNGYDGSFSGSLSWIAGKINDGLEFSGGSNFLTTTAPYASDTSFSFSCWFKTISASGGCLFSGSATDRFGWIGTDGFAYVGIFKSSVSVIKSLAAVNDGEWHHYCAVSDSSGQTTELYVDGVSQGSNGIGAWSFSGTYRVGYHTNAATWTNSSTTTNYIGDLDETGIWSRALSSTEVSQLYNSGAGLQYPFTGGSTESTIVFRRTLSPLGTRAGSRQVQ